MTSALLPLLLSLFPFASIVASLRFFGAEEDDESKRKREKRKRKFRSRSFSRINKDLRLYKVEFHLFCFALWELY